MLACKKPIFLIRFYIVGFTCKIMDNKIVMKAYRNKYNGQLSVTLSKKKLKAINPKIKFNEDLFVEMKIFKKKNGK